jgi:hypothetical protein
MFDDHKANLLLCRLDVAVDHAAVTVKHAQTDLGKHKIYARSDTGSLLHSSI